MHVACQNRVLGFLPQGRWWSSNIPAEVGERGITAMSPLIPHSKYLMKNRVQRKLWVYSPPYIPLPHSFHHPHPPHPSLYTLHFFPSAAIPCSLTSSVSSGLHHLHISSSTQASSRVTMCIQYYSSLYSEELHLKKRTLSIRGILLASWMQINYNKSEYKGFKGIDNWTALMLLTWFLNDSVQYMYFLQFGMQGFSMSHSVSTDHLNRFIS